MAFKLGYSSIRMETPDLERVLAQMRAAGWDGWELRTSLDWLGTPSRVRAISGAAGMPVCCVTGTGISLDGDWAMRERNKRRIDFAAEVEADGFMFMGASRTPGRPSSDDELARLAALSEEFADYARQYHLDVSYHIHTSTTVDSMRELTKLMARLTLCKLCIDVSHAAFWGSDPAEVIRQYRDQLVYVHLQDWKSYRFVALGEGDLLNFPAALGALEEIGYERWVVAVPGMEDRMPEAMMRVNREYLRSLGY